MALFFFYTQHYLNFSTKDFFPFLDTHRLTYNFPAPEPAVAAAPAAPTAAATQEPAPTAPAEPKPAEAKTTEAPSTTPASAAPEEPPAIPTTKPAPGMSATSGPLGDEPDFSADTKEGQPAAPAAAP